MDVYIVTAGGYADYRVIGVFSTEEKARVHIENGGIYQAEIELYELDPPSAWRNITSVCMRRDGSSFNIFTERTYEPETGHRFFQHIHGAPGVRALSAQVEADSEAEAIRMVDEIRLRLIATGEWPPEG